MAIAGRLVDIAERACPRTALAARAWHQMRRGEPHLRLIGSLATGGLAIDAGANIGVYTWTLARHLDHVIAVEPNPVSVTRLRRAAPDNVTIVAAVLGATVGHAVLNVPTAPGGHYRATVHADIARRHGAITTHRCLQLTVDTVATGAVGLIKADVEGAEAALLDGATRVLHDDRPQILIEADDTVRQGSAAEIRAFLLRAGYRELSWPGLPSGRWSNLVFTPDERLPAMRRRGFVVP